MEHIENQELGFKFELGQLVITQGAQELLERLGKSPFEYLLRHVQGDWGDMEAGDKAENEFALTRELRIFSSYQLTEEEKLWIITEADRSATTTLLPSEY